MLRTRTRCLALALLVMASVLSTQKPCVAQELRVVVVTGSAADTAGAAVAGAIVDVTQAVALPAVTLNNGFYCIQPPWVSAHSGGSGVFGSVHIYGN